MINDNLKITGALKVQLFGPDGKLKEQRDVPNLVVSVGKNFVASRMQGVLQNVMSHMAVGTGTSPAIAGDTALQTELTRVGTPDFTTAPGAQPNIVTYTGTFGPGVGTGALTEAGIFNASSAGTMLARTVFAVVNKPAGDTIIISWAITIA